MLANSIQYKCGNNKVEIVSVFLNLFRYSVYTNGFVYRNAKKTLVGQALHVCKGRNEMFYLTTHSTHFIYGYMASNIW